MRGFRWEVVEPRRWGEPPGEMSFSVLKQIEACPRRIGLERGEYEGIEVGYPRPVAWGALRGTVIHGALDEFARVYRSIPPDSDPKARAASALLQSGGLTALARKSLEVALAQLSENPRCAPVLTSARAKLERELPQMRAELSLRLEALNLPQVPAAAPLARRAGKGGGAPLGLGVYPELNVKADSIGWKGTLDMLVLSADRSVVLEYKTGEPRPEHREQLRCYAVLWALEERNATGQAPTSLTLVYKGRREEVPALGDAEVQEVKAEMMRRRSVAQTALKQIPPEAKVSHDNCRWCGVRHLCGAYWDALPTFPRAPGDFADVELELTSESGPGLYQAAVRSGPADVVSRSVAVMFPIGFSHSVGTKLRVLGARWSGEEDEVREPTLNVGQAAELFVVA